jgi:hypothetical protein
MRAKEFGLGYRIERENTLYLVPTPLVLINDQNQFHSIHAPAIRWKDGKQFYFINSVNFPFDLWQKVVSREMDMKDVLALQDIDQRTQAMKFAKNGLREFYQAEGGKMIDHFVKLRNDGWPINYELWEIPKGKTFNKTVHFAIYNCPSTKREYSKGVPEFKTVAECMAWGMGSDEYPVSPKIWKAMMPLVHES